MTEENELTWYRDFVRWLQEVAFGEEQWAEIMKAYYDDRGRLS